MEIVRDTSAIDESEKHGRRYADDVKELAFQLWETRAQKSCAKVSRLLATEEFGSLEVSARTVQRWCDDDSWDIEAVRRFEQVFPGLHHYLFRSMVYAAANGVEYWQDVNAGRIPKGDVDKNRLIAITAAFDRIGYSPIGKGTPTPKTPNDPNSINYGDLSEHELDSRESLIGIGRQSAL